MKILENTSIVFSDYINQIRQKNSGTKKLMIFTLIFQV